MLKLFNRYKKNKIVLSILMILVLIVIVSAMSSSTEALLFKVERKPFVIDLPVDGELKSLESHIVKAPSNIWRNVRIVRLAPEGSIVKEGDFLIQFDTAEFQQKLLEAQNNLEKAKANLASTMANNKSNMSDLVSNIKLESYSLEQSRLRAKNAVYESENKRKEIEFSLKKAEISYKQLVDKKQSTIKIQAAALKQAELEVEQSEIKVKRAQDDMGKMRIVSPADGLIVYKELWEGGGMVKLKVGMSPWRGQALMEIPGANKMKVSVKINEVDIAKLAVEQKVNITLDAVPDTTFTGLVKEIAALANRDRKTKKNVFDVEIYLNEEDERMKPGMSANAQIIIDEIPDVLSVPIDAITVENEKTWVNDSDGDPIEITTGKSSSDFIVVEDGLEDGDEIQLSGESGGSDQSKKKRKPKNKNGSNGTVIIMG
ncbi:MAG: HlyD family efflux transporter periplasmic adaptor subunit [Calditrichaeota bacterium]|nr:MAG: HlyD family efflux transporter periplasmic adaptor subunit [Calditrichota bacterium]MBL1204797.1 HlyD family efflux transporter periplasmic adaptor subunit [Calditrichota bacterium]NOG44626.1 HlyD family efflux transporter periplasmic adaptor subunit [Calditrichota bacterium]